MRFEVNCALLKMIAVPLLPRPPQALLVNVTASSPEGDTKPFFTSHAMRVVSTHRQGSAHAGGREA